MTEEFSHIDEQGRARMVDVGAKPETGRLARASARVDMKRATLDLLKGGALPKGEVLAVARVAGIMAAKETARLVPMCHPLNPTYISVEFDLDENYPAVLIETTVSITGRTGVEMEALTAASVAALTVYDMCKAVDKEMTIGDIRVLEKRGGKSDTSGAEQGKKGKR